MSRLKVLGPILGLTAVLSLTLSAATQADSTFTPHNGGSDIQWSTRIAHRNATVSVAGPDGFYLRKSARSINGLRLSQLPKDGQYNYEIVLTPLVERVRGEDDAKTIRKRADNGNVYSGTFRVVDGLIADPRVQE